MRLGRGLATALVMFLTMASAVLPTLVRANQDEPAIFLVGAAVRDITPNPTVAPPDGRVWLGGLGVGATNRKSTGVAVPIKARAMVVSNQAGDTLAFAINETQGMFAAYQPTIGPYGLDDMRKSIRQATGIPMQHIVLGSNHTHAGPDTTGVWGGVPATYLKYIHDQMVAAVVEAYQNRVEATILVGSSEVSPSAYGGDPLDLSCCPEQNYVDRTVRVLQAKRVSEDPNLNGRTVVTFIEAPFHSTDAGGTLIHPSWPGTVSEMAANQYGGVGVGWQGDVGRQSGSNPGVVFPAAQAAIAAAAPITDSTVDGRVQMVLEEVTNPIYIYFLNAAYPASFATCLPAGTPAGLLCNPVARANTPPYGAGVAGGFWVTTFRIGNILLSGGPGEVYPNLAKDIVDRVDADHHFYLGLAQDQIGYIIGPTEHWREVVVARTAEGNDNGLFNAGPTVGDHLVCTHLNAAASLGFTVSTPPSICSTLTLTDPAAAITTELLGLS